MAAMMVVIAVAALVFLLAAVIEWRHNRKDIDWARKNQAHPYQRIYEVRGNPDRRTSGDCE